MSHKTVFKVLEQWVPLSLAYDWDNAGLQIGSDNLLTTKIMVTLDVTEAVVDEAISVGANLIIAHHPLFFKGIKSINYDAPKGRVIKKIIAHNLTVYSAHTNLDIAVGGVNDMLSDALDIKVEGNLIDVDSESLGLGRVGTIKTQTTLAAFCEEVKTAYELDGVIVTGDLNKQIKRVAVLGGSGEKFIKNALEKDVDVYITGDISYHFAQDAQEAGLAIIDAGHYIEKIMKQATVSYLRENIPENKLEIVVSRVNTDPFRFV